MQAYKNKTAPLLWSSNKDFYCKLFLQEIDHIFFNSLLNV